MFINDKVSVLNVINFLGFRGVPCPNRDQYIFWDAFHPTAAANIIIGRKALNGDLSQVYPMNIQQLTTLNIKRSP